ncbi:MAG: ATP-binding protein [Patescibacteria group bacterium]
MLIARALQPILRRRLQEVGKVIVLYGARQVGKTTLMREVLREVGGDALSINADEGKYVEALSSRDLRTLQNLIGRHDLLFIDEAQRVPNIGVGLKLLLERLPSLRIAVTGSSTLDLASAVREPLTGRTWTYTLHPIAFLELAETWTPFALRDSVEERLTYGAYPALFAMMGKEDKEKYLEEMSTAYLYRDILDLSGIRHPSGIRRLLQLLAFQIGSQVSLTELGAQLGISKDTVAHYIDLLEAAFVVFRLPGYSRNLRKEVTKMDKIYFYDLGVRNAIIGNFNDLKHRNDTGQLWENFLMVERMKRHSYTHISGNRYFWRTYTGAELDLVEERGGKLFGYEFAWSARRRTRKPPRTWLQTYPEASYEIITQENFLDFVCK